MTDITRKDFEDLTSAMVDGFQGLHNRLDGMDERMDAFEDTQNKHSEMLDHIAGRVDDLWVEAGAQTQANRRFEARLDRLEQQLGLSAMTDDMIAA